MENNKISNKKSYCEYCDVKSGFYVCSGRCNKVKPNLLNDLIKLNEKAIKENWKMSEVGEQFFKIFAYN